MHVGDQYHSDVLGARNAGIRPLMIDRDGLHQEISDCPRISSLGEVVEHLCPATTWGQIDKHQGLVYVTRTRI